MNQSRITSIETSSALFAARFFSALFRPVYYPLVGFVVLLCFSYLKMLPWQYKVWVLGLVFVNTIVLPSFLVGLYRRWKGWKRMHLRYQSNRTIPYVIHILCYALTYYIMRVQHMPHFMLGIFMVAILIQTICLVVNVWWKVSVHSAGAGGLVGGLYAYSLLFSFDPTWWLCGTILLAGIVQTSRMVLRQHTLSQVLVGTLIGVVCGYVGILF